MTSEKAQWTTQTTFDGGIQQQPEVATKNSVLDALNVWTPFSRAERRPGYSSLPGLVQGIVPGRVSGTWTFFAPNGSIISTGSLLSTITVPSPLNAGSRLVLVLPETISGNPLNGLRYTSNPSGGFPPFPSFFFSILGVETSRGTIILDTPGYPSGLTGAVYINFVLPPDVTVDGSGNITLTFFLTNTFTSTPDIYPDAYTTASNVSLIASAHKIEYNGGTRYLLFQVLSNNRYGFTQSTSLINSNGLAQIKNVGGSSEFPPQIAVVPEFDESYFVFGGTTIKITLGPDSNTTTNAVVASTQDGTIVGVPPTQMACYGTFPGGSQIINFRGHLFANGSAQNNQQNILFWNFGNLSETSSGAIVDTSNIWPVTAFSALSDARDNSEITALFPVGDNLGVAKKNSIWLAPLVQAATPGAISGGVVTQNAVLVDQFAAQLVVPGVGCLAPGSVQAIPGGILLLAEDAFYLFDGTPSIKPRSYQIQDYVNRINPGRKSYAQAINWRTNRMYFCAVSLDDNSTTNDTVLAYDYQSDGWWVFQGRNKSLDIICWLILDGVGFREELWFQDSKGNLNRFIGDTDYGLPIDSYIVTQRFNEFALLGSDVTEIRTQSINNQQTIVQPSVELIVDDIPVATQHETDPGATTKPVTFPLSGEVLWSQPPVSGTSAYAPERRRERKTPVTGSGFWFQAKVSNFMQYIMVAFGFTPNGRR